MTAIYDLCKLPTTFDFAPWACYARTCGATKVHFIIDGPIAQWKYSQDIAWKRFANILLPLCKLAGLEYTVGGRIEGRQFTYLAGHLNALYKQLGRIEKLKPTQRKERPPYITVTLRDSFRNRYRNSNMNAWDQFTKYLERKNVNVMVFPECEDSPMNLEHRMDLVCGADMNLGVPNGPMALCVFSEAPYITINQFPENKGEKVQYSQKKMMESQGMGEGFQFAFRNSRQILIYEPDNFENIVKAYEGMMERKQEAA